MATWRIRITMSDDAHTRARLLDVLAGQQVKTLELTPRDGSESTLTGDVVLDLPRDDKLGDLLSALHMISPQVFVSRAAADRSVAPDHAIAALIAAD